MKRMHIHVGVTNLSESIRFYTALFAVAPTKTKDDYAKWMLEDPSVNFAISTREGSGGVAHLGVEVSEASELAALRDRFRQADLAMFDENQTRCCYARSDKTWVEDPSGVAWESFRTIDDIEVFGQTPTDVPDTKSACP